MATHTRRRRRVARDLAVTRDAFPVVRLLSLNGAAAHLLPWSQKTRTALCFAPSPDFGRDAPLQPAARMRRQIARRRNAGGYQAAGVTRPRTQPAFPLPDPQRRRRKQMITRVSARPAVEDGYLGVVVA